MQQVILLYKRKEKTYQCHLSLVNNKRSKEGKLIFNIKIKWANLRKYITKRRIIEFKIKNCRLKWITRGLNLIKINNNLINLKWLNKHQWGKKKRLGNIWLIIK